VVVDEAGAASQVETLHPLMLGAEKVVLIGDDRQLRPYREGSASKMDNLLRELHMHEQLLWRRQVRFVLCAHLDMAQKLHLDLFISRSRI
jgi:superfamily I DNA and/or RNA helicase